jgi:cytochrome P450
LNLRDPFPLMDALQRKYTDPMTCPLLGQGPMVLVWRPDNVRAVFGAAADAFEPGTSEALAPIVGRGSLFLLSGERHRRARKLLMPPFHGDRMRAYATTIAHATQRWLDQWSPGQERAFLPIAQGITLDVIISAIFGVSDPARIEQLHRLLVNAVESFSPLIATFAWLQREFGGIGPWARFKRQHDALQGTILELIDEKRANPGADVLSLLLSASDEDGTPLTEQEIVEQLLTFAIAGHETTATTLSWSLYELHRNPIALEQLRNELATTADADPHAMATLPFTTAVVRETLRRHPPVPIIPRKCARPLQLGDYELPQGQSIGVSAYNAHHDPETYPEPFAFRPERFIDSKPSPFTFFPFGGGNRRCLGAAFASYELNIALATILKQATFTLTERKPVGHAFRIGTFGPATGIRLLRES